MNQLLATFYVQAPDYLFEDVTVAAEVQYQSGSNWYQNSSELTATVTNAHYNDPANDNQLRRRYKIDVFRVESQTYDYYTYESVDYYPLYKAGTYKRRLSIRFNNVQVLERMIYLTIQPDLHVYRDVEGTQVDLITTTATTVSPNPLNRQLTVNVASTASALAARKILMNEPNSYKETVFIKSNLPVDSYGNDLAVETSSEYGYDSNTWLQLAGKIRITRKLGNSEHKWSGYYDYSPIIRQDDRGKYATFISDDADEYYGTNLLNTESVKAGRAVELGLEKPPLALPLFFQSELSLCGRGVNRYTGSGETVETTAAILLPLTAILKTPHRIKITPTILTLDEDNNYTSFVAVEANEGANWTLAPVNNKLTVTPTTGTGRAPVVIKKAASFNLGNSNFENVALTATSTVNSTTYPDIDGAYTASDTSAVHIEQYTPARNALIPKMTGESTAVRALPSADSDTWKSFDRTLSHFGCAGQWTDGLGSNWAALDNLDSFPTIEVTFDKTHRIRSWSLQSVGNGNALARLATTLVLRGQTLDNEWKILDIAQLSSYNFYSNDKIREDRTVHHREVVSKIRISVIATQYSGSGSLVHLPQIQVFAGVPLLPKMTSNYDNKFAVRANSSENGTRVFDREVSGSTIATVGSRAWYINNNHFLLEDVAENGKISQFGSYQSKGWLSLIFPVARLLGYLYSIDNLQARSDNHANTSYAASLYFEGRETSNDGMTLEPSLGNWNFIDLVSLDQCLGHNDFDGMATPALIVQSNQTTIKNYLTSLGLPVVHDSFLMNRTDRHILRYNATTEKWYDDGLRLEQVH